MVPRPSEGRLLPDIAYLPPKRVAHLPLPTYRLNVSHTRGPLCRQNTDSPTLGVSRRVERVEDLAKADFYPSLTPNICGSSVAKSVEETITHSLVRL